MAYYFRRRSSFNYSLIRKYFIRLTILGGALGFILALVGANMEANSDRGVPMDGTMSGLMLFGTIIGIALLYLVEKINKEKKSSMAVLIFFSY